MLETDFTNAKGSATDYSFKNEDGGTLKMLKLSYIVKVIFNSIKKAKVRLHVI